MGGNMIFVLHYLLFNAGLPAVIILITLFLQTYSHASLSEIGTLLMALPFLSILIKPLFGALADRHNAHRLYLMGGLAIMALGYGSLAIAPFFPAFIAAHGRLVWYLDVVGIMVGFSAFGVVWSLGDALAVNGAQMAGVSWGFYRMFGVIAWGSMGIIMGQINEVPFLPKYVPAMLVLVVCLLAEVLLLALWPNKYFVMCGSHQDGPGAAAGSPSSSIGDGYGADDQAAIVAPAHSEARLSARVAEMEAQWPANRSLTGTLTAGTLGHTSPRMIGAVANIFMEDLGDALKSSLKLGAKPRRAGLEEILEQHQSRAAAEQQQQRRPSAAGTLRRVAGLGESEAAAAPAASPPSSKAATPASTLGKAAALRAVNIAAACNAARAKEPPLADLTNLAGDPSEGPQTLEAARAAPKSAEDLQLVLLKLIVMRDKTIAKYMALFTLFGFLLTCHLSYFYLHLERLCREKGADFSSVMGGMLATHSVSEMLAFMAVPLYIGRVGRVGGLLTCALAYFVRFAYYGTYFVANSPYTGVPFEFCHGIAYGIVYTLITDVAIERVDQVDEFLPELVARGLVPPDAHLGRLKSALRATMQGVFSGAFDGLGNGLGALFGGVFLDAYPFERLWQFCALVSLAILVVYPLTEWRALAGRPKPARAIPSLPPMAGRKEETPAEA